MKRSKKILLEMSSLPVVRKNLVPESTTSAKDIKAGDIIRLSDRKEYVVVYVGATGRIAYVPYQRLQYLDKNEVEGIEVQHGGMGNFKKVAV